MLYAIICYNDEKLVSAWSKAEDDAVMERTEIDVCHRLFPRSNDIAGT